MTYLRQRFVEGANPRSIILSLASSSSPLGTSSRYSDLFDVIPSHLNDDILWRVI